MRRIALQGQNGSFHHQVALDYFGAAITPIYCDTFKAVFDSLATQQADAAVCAIENSLYGSIGDVYDLLMARPYAVTGEAIKHIRQQLIAHPEASLSDITEIYSHPAALGQCREYLEQNFPHAEIIEHHDTAGAVEHIKTMGLRQAAAIAGSHAAAIHAMAVLAHNIEDEPTNLTRFVVLDPSAVASSTANKASLVLNTDHSSGALYRALGIFASHSINLTKIQSRPKRGERFRYQFFIDAECDAPTLARIHAELEAQGCTVRVLGHYPAAMSPSSQ